MTLLDATAAAAPGAAAPASTGVRFLGDRRDYWRLLVRGSALLAFTLGIYRFWLATDIRRFLWSNTEIAGDGLEYTGTALELLIGFLIALAVIVPLYVGFFAITLNLGEIGQLISSLAFPLLFFLGQIAIYRARRYRLTRTVFRGVRCHQSGSAWRYAICATFWWAMIIVTLGLAYPFAQASLERYKMRNTFYGNLPGHFAGSGWRLFWRGLPMWILVVGPLLVAIVFLFVGIAAVDWDDLAKAAGSKDELLARIEALGPTFYGAMFIAVLAVVFGLLMVALLYPVFQAMTLRWWIAGLRFGDLTVASRLRTGQIYGAYLRFLGWGLLFLIVAAIVAVAAVAGFDHAFQSAEPKTVEIAGTLGALVLYVLMMLGFSAIYQATVKLAMWRCGVETATLGGIGVLDTVRAEGAAASPYGEGLADALHVGGF